MNQRALEAEIATIADTYRGRPLDELQDLLQHQWSTVQEDDPVVPVRDAEDYWKRVIKRLKAKVIANRDAVSATGGVAASQVLMWFSSLGLDAAPYRVSLGILTAAVIQAVLEEADQDKKDDDGPRR